MQKDAFWSLLEQIRDWNGYHMLGAKRMDEIEGFLIHCSHMHIQSFTPKPCTCFPISLFIHFAATIHSLIHMHSSSFTLALIHMQTHSFSAPNTIIDFTPIFSQNIAHAFIIIHTLQPLHMHFQLSTNLLAVIFLLFHL